MTGFRDVAGKIAIITGGARGIGRGCAETFAAEGIHVVIADILPIVHETWKEIKEQFPDNEGYSVQLDVSDEMAVKDMVEGVVAKFGRLDIMYNNAGMHAGGAEVSDTNMADVDRVFAVNFKGIFHGCKYAAIQMKKQRFGTIVNTGSFFGKVGHAGSATYGASKAAVHTLTQALALEMAPYNVNVNALCPGLAATDMHWGFMREEAAQRGITFEELKEEELRTIPLHRYGTGADSAGAIMWLATPSGSYVTGQLININGGLDFT
jgi:NAD(P)-dependent dehydrogenase (short-subunit alcohol dehydrogenase family)